MNGYVCGVLIAVGILFLCCLFYKCMDAMILKLAGKYYNRYNRPNVQNIQNPVADDENTNLIRDEETGEQN